MSLWPSVFTTDGRKSERPGTLPALKVIVVDVIVANKFGTGRRPGEISSHASCLRTRRRGSFMIIFVRILILDNDGYNTRRRTWHVKKKGGYVVTNTRMCVLGYRKRVGGCRGHYKTLRIYTIIRIFTVMEATVPWWSGDACRVAKGVYRWRWCSSEKERSRRPV